MNVETVKLLIRHALTIVGTLLLARGVTTEGQWQDTTNIICDAAGGAMTAAALVWSILKKMKREKLEAAIAAAKAAAEEDKEKKP